MKRFDAAWDDVPASVTANWWMNCGIVKDNYCTDVGVTDFVNVRQRETVLREGFCQLVSAHGWVTIEELFKAN